MKPGLRDRNNHQHDVRLHVNRHRVSMKSGLRDRNNNWLWRIPMPRISRLNEVRS